MEDREQFLKWPRQWAAEYLQAMGMVLGTFLHGPHTKQLHEADLRWEGGEGLVSEQCVFYNLILHTLESEQLLGALKSPNSYVIFDNTLVVSGLSILD